MLFSPFKNIYPLMCYRILPLKQLKSTLENSAPSLTPLNAKSSKCVFVESFSGIIKTRFMSCDKDCVFQVLKPPVERKAAYTFTIL